MIRIDPDGVREIAEQCKAISASISEYTDVYADSVDNLSDNWEGKSYLRYVERAKEIVEALKDVEEPMMTFASKLVNAADRYEEIDNSF